MGRRSACTSPGWAPTPRCSSLPPWWASSSSSTGAPRWTRTSPGRTARGHAPAEEQSPSGGWPSHGLPCSAPGETSDRQPYGHPPRARRGVHARPVGVIVVCSFSFGVSLQQENPLPGCRVRKRFGPWCRPGEHVESTAASEPHLLWRPQGCVTAELGISQPTRVSVCRPPSLPWSPRTVPGLGRSERAARTPQAAALAQGRRSSPAPPPPPLRPPGLAKASPCARQWCVQAPSCRGTLMMDIVLRASCVPSLCQAPRPSPGAQAALASQEPMVPASVSWRLSQGRCQAPLRQSRGLESHP